MARLGEILVEDAGLEPEQVEQAAEEAREQGFRLGAQLLVRKLISEEQLAQALARQCELPYCEVIPDGASEELLEQIPIGYARSQQIIPLDRDGETVTLIVADPLAVETCNDLAVLLQARIACRVATVITSYSIHYTKLYEVALVITTVRIRSNSVRRSCSATSTGALHRRTIV